MHARLSPTNFHHTTTDVTIPGKPGTVGYKDIKVPIARTATNDIIDFWISSSGGVAIDSDVPQETSKASVYQYTDVVVTINASQTGTDFTLPSAALIRKAPAYTSYATDSDVIVGTTTTYHAAVPKEDQLGERLHAFSLTIQPNGGAGKASIVDSIGATEGEVIAPVVTNIGIKENNGSVLSVRNLYAIESGNDVILHGYVAIESVGKDDVLIEIPINDLMTN